MATMKTLSNCLHVNLIAHHDIYDIDIIIIILKILNFNSKNYIYNTV